ncbi:MRPS12 [Cordylochernes scorpioides]|uniref:Small ribosomal subunit protein uS12m n=1 Tax=Cordylochernes scorpioides TaxID=51811 RepID=A0ABY6L0Y0_9ARAC|nr:MRPS12 [Cordylochernes scorpioides]
MELPLSSPAKCELRSVIRFLNAKNNSLVEIHRQLVEVYGEKCMDIKNVRKWCREFNEGRINVHDEQRSGRPSLPESTVNRRITLEEIEDGLNEDCSHFSVHKIVSETLGYRKWPPATNGQSTVSRQLLAATPTSWTAPLSLSTTPAVACPRYRRREPRPQSLAYKQEAAILLKRHYLGPEIPRKRNNKLLMGKMQAKGIVLKTVIKKPKKPNSANRKCVFVRLSTGREAYAYVPGEGHTLQEHNRVLVEGGRTKDVPGLKLKVIRGKLDCGKVIKSQPSSTIGVQE